MTYKSYMEAKEAYPDCDAIFTTGPKWNGDDSRVGDFIPTYLRPFDNAYFECGDCIDREPPIDGSLCIGDYGWVMCNNKTQSGGSCNYYMVDVIKPTTLPESYTIECNDLIEALGLSFKEANIIKEIFRTANERTNGNGKKGNTEKRAAEKILFFAIRNAIANDVDIAAFTSDINTK